jgi:hypothetical protein
VVERTLARTPGRSATQTATHEILDANLPKYSSK